MPASAVPNKTSFPAVNRIFTLAHRLRPIPIAVSTPAGAATSYWGKQTVTSAVFSISCEFVNPEFQPQ
jgi:hypothetical protein